MVLHGFFDPSNNKRARELQSLGKFFSVKLTFFHIFINNLLFLLLLLLLFLFLFLLPLFPLLLLLLFLPLPLLLLLLFLLLLFLLLAFLAFLVL
ncbi:hypothetical protein O3M35_004557 [Rhynocoris fuscipes]|uniref:Uncharacterized protein n=1 Tax=Rhynocoris fuscipes TaxID=488301 RepID=A0AAW1CG33_9HEMI